jgi:uncharacterized protein (DUF1697 family)
MTVWVALLRGVNVGGVTIRSAELREVFEGLGFDAVRTVLASGNVVFQSAGPRGPLAARIEAALGARFDYEAKLVLVTVGEVQTAIDGFPFDEQDDARQPWVIFCLDSATRDELADAAAGLDPAVDPVHTGAGVVYWNPAKGSSTDTPFAKLIAKRTYRERTTNRNLRTLRRIVG